MIWWVQHFHSIIVTLELQEGCSCKWGFSMRSFWPICLRWVVLVYLEYFVIESVLSSEWMHFHIFEFLFPAFDSSLLVFTSISSTCQYFRSFPQFIWWDKRCDFPILKFLSWIEFKSPLSFAPGRPDRHERWFCAKSSWEGGQSLDTWWQFSSFMHWI